MSFNIRERGGLARAIAASLEAEFVLRVGSGVLDF
jgi:hypothetical protein